MPLLELMTPEAIYTNDTARGGHFAIDCTCGGKDGKYSGSHYKNSSEDLAQLTKNYEPSRANKYEHTFYLSEELFLFKLEEEHNETNGQTPLVIVCNDCSREFQFTNESYTNLNERMLIAYNRNKH